MASLVPVEPSVGSKRKNSAALEEELIRPTNKHLRLSHQDSQSLTDTSISQAEKVSANSVCNGQHAAPKTVSGESNGRHEDSPNEEMESKSQQEDVQDNMPENDTNPNGFVPTCSASAGHKLSSSDTFLIVKGDTCGEGEKDDVGQVKNPHETLNRSCSLDSNQRLLTDEDIHSTKINTPSPQHNETEETRQKSPCEGVAGVESETETGITEADDLVDAPSQLFWRNSNNLCWLDSLLVALVNCKSLRQFMKTAEPQQSPVRQLLTRYEDISTSVQVQHQTCRDGVVRVPHHVLQRAYEDLHSLRMSIFKHLQPKLQCKLGNKEGPVFAMPLLLSMDSWAEPLFQLTFQWEFKCSECKAATTERVMKTLPTFTNIFPDWRPLHAVHFAPCNECGMKKQRRTMLLESSPPVLALHFVDGLPDNDVAAYNFSFKGKRYSITTVIQYKQQLKHFVTWTRGHDGFWVEFDDLKHPDCKTHQKLLVPAQEMHIVFWEAEDSKEPKACSPSSTFKDSPSPTQDTHTSVCHTDLRADKLLTTDQPTPDLSDDVDFMCALSASEDTTVTHGLDVSIGSTTLLDTFEGLSHNDIITLTLVELKPDSETQPLIEGQQSPDVVIPSNDEILDSTPDSSSNVSGDTNIHDHEAEPPSASNSSASEDNLSSDPTFVPEAKGRKRRTRGAGRGKPTTRQNSKKPASSKAASSVPATPKPAKVARKKPEEAPVQVSPPPVESMQQVSPVSSTDASPLCTDNNSPVAQTTLDQNARWSFLLSQHPLHKMTSKAALTPVTQVKKQSPRSTPNPVRKPQISEGVVNKPQISGAVFVKPQLKTEKSDSLPMKAAEMYGAFSTKSSNPPSPFPTAVHVSDKSSPLQPHTLANTSLTSATSLPILREKETSSSKKHSSQSLKIPPGLTPTEALRYRLIKKLKAKKKKLAKLNQMLGHQDGASLRPDSTDLGSPNTVTSSTYDSSICDDFLSDLLSPATTASNLSPDSTGFLEMLYNGQEGVEELDSGVGANSAASRMNSYVTEPNRDSFLDDFLTQAVAQRQTDAETEALSALDLF